MRIIAGTFRGREILAPRGLAVRPPLDRLRGAIFNSLCGLLPGAAVLDLFAGSGSMGLEALSRGAASCAFVEDGREALAALRENIAALGAAGAEVHPGAFPGALGSPALTGRRFDVVLADPPFDHVLAGRYADLEARCAALMAPGAVLVLRLPADPPLRDCRPLALAREKREGLSLVRFLRLEAGSPT